MKHIILIPPGDYLLTCAQTSILQGMYREFQEYNRILVSTRRVISEELCNEK